MFSEIAVNQHFCCRTRMCAVFNGFLIAEFCPHCFIELHCLFAVLICTVEEEISVCMAESHILLVDIIFTHSYTVVLFKIRLCGVSTLKRKLNCLLAFTATNTLTIIGISPRATHLAA